MMKFGIVPVIKVCLVISTLSLFSIWLGWFLYPNTMTTIYEVSATSNTGNNVLKTNISAAPFIIATFTVLYFLKGKVWLYPTGVSLICISATRILHCFSTGVSQKIIIAIALELFTALLAFSLIKQAD